MDSLPAPHEPCYVISVAAAILSVHPQTLRRYEDVGLVCPARVSGKRLYSPADIERLMKISRLVDDLGVNLAGVEIILQLTERLEQAQTEIADIRRQFEEAALRAGAH
jgi:MerR family transcriptional regulator/heat shock protein HspR